MRGFKEDSVLGRCTFCRFTVRENERKFAARFAKITHGRWICGNCLLGMKDAITEAEKVYEEEGDDRTKMLKDIGYSLNPETGKLEKINDL